ncbi:hypothetical protein D3C87_1029360 [compost metagenome]
MATFRTALTLNRLDVVTLTSLPAATITRSGVARPIPLGADSAITARLRSASSSFSHWFSAFMSATSAWAARATCANSWACACVNWNWSIAGVMSFCLPSAFFCMSADTNKPPPARTAPCASVRNSNPSPRRFHLPSTIWPSVSWVLPECSVDSLICSCPSQSSSSILLSRCVRMTLRDSHRSWLVIRSGWQLLWWTWAMYGLFGFPSRNAMAASVPSINGKWKPVWNAPANGFARRSGTHSPPPGHVSKSNSKRTV